VVRVLAFHLYDSGSFAGSAAGADLEEGPGGEGWCPTFEKVFKFLICYLKFFDLCPPFLYFWVIYFVCAPPPLSKFLDLPLNSGDSELSLCLLMLFCSLSCHEGFSLGSPVFLHRHRKSIRICKDECKIVNVAGSECESISRIATMWMRCAKYLIIFYSFVCFIHLFIEMYR